MSVIVVVFGFIFFVIIFVIIGNGIDGKGGGVDVVLMSYYVFVLILFGVYFM